jgi:asparagine synthase (glutamine-hydrolysing)
LRESLPQAVSTLAYRGPDDSGLFFDEKAGVGLGHRRLSVIDLSTAGRQPMASEDGRVQITHNGEVYNFKEIRDALEGCGHSFHSGTDTEVILKAYLQWGIDCVNRFVGMFAFALWDGRKKCLFLARDRLGIKPLYYHFSRGNLLFASELKALMAFKNFDRNIDSDAVPLFLHYQYIPAPRTIFRNTHKLLPGYYIIFDGQELASHAYWRLPELSEDLASSYPTDEERLEGLDSLFTQAVSRSTGQ